MKYISKVVVVTMVVCCYSAPAMAQDQHPPDIIAANTKRCQLNTIYIADLKQVARIKNERVFVIAHLGSGETSSALNRRRLRDIGAEFDEISPMSRDKLILAQGQRLRGRGRVEVYLGSELYFVSYMPRNGAFCSACCDRKHEFYEHAR
jgi:hypothetical protein